MIWLEKVWPSQNKKKYQNNAELISNISKQKIFKYIICSKENILYLYFFTDLTFTIKLNFFLFKFKNPLKNTG